MWGGGGRRRLAAQTYTSQVFRTRRFKDLAEDLLSILAVRRRGQAHAVPLRPFLLFCRIVLAPNGIIPPSTFLFFNCTPISGISRYRFPILCSFCRSFRGLAPDRSNDSRLRAESVSRLTNVFLLFTHIIWFCFICSTSLWLRERVCSVADRSLASRVIFMIVNSNVIFFLLSRMALVAEVWLCMRVRTRYHIIPGYIIFVNDQHDVCRMPYYYLVKQYPYKIIFLMEWQFDMSINTDKVIFNLE